MRHFDRPQLFAVISICSVFLLLCPASLSGIAVTAFIGLVFIILYFQCVESFQSSYPFSKRENLYSLAASIILAGCLLDLFISRWIASDTAGRISGMLHIPENLFVRTLGILAAFGASAFFFMLFHAVIAELRNGTGKNAFFSTQTVSDSVPPTGVSYTEKLVILLCSVGAVTFCSKSSPLYPFNDWVDVNCFFTVGKSMMNGLVPYRDLFEQKGPLLYFLYGLTWLVSNDTFLGGYFLEIIAAYFFLLYSYRITISLVKEKYVFLIPTIAFFTYTSQAFEEGGGSEELCLAILSFSLWMIIREFSNGQTLQQKRQINCERPDRLKYRLGFVVIGFAAGCVFWMKFTLVGLYAGWFIWFLCDSAKRRTWKELQAASLLIAGGVVLATIPWVLYFGINHAIKDWLEVYLYDNLFIYTLAEVDGSRLSGIPILSGLLNGFYCWGTYDHITMLVCTVSFLVLLLQRRERLSKMLMLMMFGTFFFIYVGGLQYRYYSLVMDVFLAPCFALLLTFVPRKKPVLATRKAIISSVAICLFGSFLVTPNRYFMRVPKEDLAQYRFKEIITQNAEDPTILNYGFLDGGFYTVCNIIPNCKAFCGLNMPLDEVKELQEHYVENGLCDYVITRTGVGETPDEFKRYEKLAECKSNYSWGELTYHLYKLHDR